MRLFFASCLLRLLSWIPLGVGRSLGKGLGAIFSRFNGRERRVTKKNLELCFPSLNDEERADLLKRSLQESACWIFELGGIWLKGAKWRQQVINKIHNQELYQHALESDQGILLLLPHFGNWELAGLWAGDQAKGTGMYRSPKLEDLDPLVRKAREGSALTKMVPATSRGVMAIFKALKKGEQTAILPDQVPSAGAGIYSDFYRTPALTQTLVHSLISKTRPQVLMIYAYRVKGGFELGFQEPDAEIYSEDQQTSVDALNRSIEKLIELAPAQYQWEYKRFKNQQDRNDPYV